ncbi:MAG: hypothetical protein ACAH11_05980 [Sphingomonas sp.]
MTKTDRTREEDVLRSMLNTPAKPHAKPKESTDGKPVQRPASDLDPEDNRGVGLSGG